MSPLHLALEVVVDNLLHGDMSCQFFVWSHAVVFDQPISRCLVKQAEVFQQQAQAASATGHHSRQLRAQSVTVRGVVASLLAAHRRLFGYIDLVGGGLGVRHILHSADDYTELNNRLHLVSDSEAALMEVREGLLAVRQRTRTEWVANAALYSRIVLASSDLNYSQSELLRVTELLNKQVAIGGNNSSEAGAGLVQFAQGLASGRLQGDELRSVPENLQGA